MATKTHHEWWGTKTLYLIFQLIVRAEKRWCWINAPQLVEKVLARVTFADGIEASKENNQTEKHTA